MDRRSPLGGIRSVPFVIPWALFLLGAAIPWTVQNGRAEEPALFLDITEPANNSLLRYGNITVSGRTVPGANVTINGEQTFNDNGSFTKDLIFPEGPGAIHLLVRRGNDTLEKVLNLTIDMTSPRIEILEPVTVPWKSSRKIACRVQSEPGVNVTLNGVPMRYEGNGIYYGEADRLDYPWVLRVNATDAAGNMASKSYGAYTPPPPPATDTSLLARLEPWMVPTLILGIGLIVAGLVMRWKRR